MGDRQWPNSYTSGSRTFGAASQQPAMPLAGQYPRAPTYQGPDYGGHHAQGYAAAPARADAWSAQAHPYAHVQDASTSYRDHASYRDPAGYRDHAGGGMEHGSRAAYPTAAPVIAGYGSAATHRGWEEPSDSRGARQEYAPPGAGDSRGRITGGKRSFTEEPRRWEEEAPAGGRWQPPPNAWEAVAPAPALHEYRNVSQAPPSAASQEREQAPGRERGQKSDPYLQYYGGRSSGGRQQQDAAAAAPLPAPAAMVPRYPNIQEPAPRPVPRPAPSALRPAAPAPAAPRGHASIATTPGQDPLAASLEQLASRTSSHGAVFTRLTQNVADVVRRLDPSPSDFIQRRQVLQIIIEAIKFAFPEYPNARATPFGSFVSGLGTKDSDLDIVITGIQEPSTGFYQSSQRPQIARLLDRAAAAFHRFPELRSQIKKQLIIRTARIPLARFTLDSGLVIDLSIAGSSGPLAAQYLGRQVTTWPALRPLTLTVKAYLKYRGLNDVSTGGLSSYGITYMVLAHLQEEAKLKHDTSDLGFMLLRFFQRYGSSYNVYEHVVAVGLGGIVTRNHAEQGGAEYFKNADRLATVDPLTGRDCTEGCYQTQDVLNGLSAADRYLSSIAIKHQDHSLSSLAKMDLLHGLMSSSGSLEEDGDVHGYGRPGKRR